MLGQILEFLIDSVTGFFIFLLLARFHFQWLRVPFRNQAGGFIIGLTNWMVMPARRLIPTVAGLDLPTFLLAWVAQGATLALILMLRGTDFSGAPGLAAGVLSGLALLDLLRHSPDFRPAHDPLLALARAIEPTDAALAQSLQAELQAIRARRAPELRPTPPSSNTPQRMIPTP